MKKKVHFPKIRKLSYENKENRMKKKLDKHRILSVRKMNRDEKNNKEINKEIESYFFCPEKYFQKNSPVTIGKKIDLIDMNDPSLRRSQKLRTEKKTIKNFLNNTRYNNLSILYRNDHSILNNSIRSNVKGKENQNNHKKVLGKPSYFEIIDNLKLKLIFNSFKKHYKSQSNLDELFDVDYNNDKKYSSMEVPSNVKLCLLKQNKNLNLQKLSEKKREKISKFISKKINKPQNDLLLNRVDSFRYKKEFINAIENNRPLGDKFGKYKWNISLRRPKNFKGVRDSYINIRHEGYNPFWSVVVEKMPKQKELCLKPGYVLNNNEINELQKQNEHVKSANNSLCYKSVGNLEDLSIEGKNLYNVEYKREILDSNRKKILHKVFVDNGKAISSTEINSLYGNDTFYKNYNPYITEKYKKN